MKNLILSDCNQLIKFILFEDDEINENQNSRKEKKQKKVIRHIPRNKLWLRKKFLMKDDLELLVEGGKIKEKKSLKPENNMELAIYHCKSKSEIHHGLIIYHA
jgi:hypothetical protein